ncbi:MAG: tetratricopeptide repeat protein [Spirochaetia bacterium]
MAGQRALSKSTRLLRTRRFSEVISLLEPQVFLYRENFTFYRNLGTACLYVGDFGGAFSYLQRAHQLRNQNPSILIGLAAVHLRRRQVTEALQYWLQILDQEPRNPIAKRGLALVRTTTDPSVFITMAESGKLRRFYPALGFSLPRWVLPTGAVVVVAAAAVILWPLSGITLSPVDTPIRDGTELTLIDRGMSDWTDFSGEFRYVLTNTEIEDTFARIGELFNEFRDNLAQREVNLLLNSNASDLIKERARLLSSYFTQPTFVDFGDNYTYSEVAGEPWLYDGCYVRWSGRVSNIAGSNEAVRFTLLVGYEDERVLEGTVPVSVPFAVEIQPGPIELIAQVSFVEGLLSLTATSIRRLAPIGGS